MNDYETWHRESGKIEIEELSLDVFFVEKGLVLLIDAC